MIRFPIPILLLAMTVAACSGPDEGGIDPDCVSNGKTHYVCLPENEKLLYQVDNCNRPTEQTKKCLNEKSCQPGGANADAFCGTSDARTDGGDTNTDGGDTDGGDTDGGDNDGGDTIPTGSLGGACYGNNTCDDALVCEAKLCVDASTPPPVTDIANPGDSVTITGTVPSAGATYNRRNDSCRVDSKGNGVRFDVLHLRNDTGAAQSLNIIATWATGDGYLHAYSTFDPQAPATGCVSGNDDFNDGDDSGLENVAIAKGQTLVLVVSAYDKLSHNALGDYSIEVETIDATCLLPSNDTVCKEGDKHVYKSNACGVATTRKTTCTTAMSCEVMDDGQAHCSCPLMEATVCRSDSSLSTLYEPSAVWKKRACTNPAGAQKASDRIEDCEWGSVCFREDGFNGDDAQCRRSIDASQKDMPYYNFGCGTFDRWLRHPTSLEMDCRCRYVGDGQGGAGGTGNALADPNNTDINNGARPGGPIINCMSGDSMPDYEWPVKYGDGPSFNAWYQQNASGASWFGGDVNPATREMFAIVKWTNPQYYKSATVVAWNLDTKNRRVVSGLHPDPQEGLKAYGTGYLSPKVNAATAGFDEDGDGDDGGPDTGAAATQPLTGANVLRLVTEQDETTSIYTYGGGTGESSSTQREIVRINPTTGERTLVWQAQSALTGDITATHGQCFRPGPAGENLSIAYQAQAFEVGPDGTFYLSMHGVREGDGIVSISADGKTCTVHSRWGGGGYNPGGGVTPVPAPAAIGTGPSLQPFPVKGLLFHDGKIFGVYKTDLYSFDLTNGNWRLESHAAQTYKGMGYANMFWDPTRSVVWALGDHASPTGTIVDLSTGRREAVYADTDPKEYSNNHILRSVYGTAESVSYSMLGVGNSIGNGGAILDPADNNILYAVLKSGGLMKLELSTFNNYVYSW